MTFLHEWRLLLLLAPLLLLGAYLLVQRRRHSQVVRFTSVDLLDSVAPSRSGWQRHVPGALVLVSLVAMVIAFAQPVMAVPTAKDRTTIVLALDTSASMAATDVSPNRLEAAEAQAREFVAKVPDGVQVGLVTFDTSARLLVPPTEDHNQVLDALGDLPTGPGTATAAGIQASVAAIQDASRTDATASKTAHSTIVLMSDGTPTVADGGADPIAAAETAAADAKTAGIMIDTIAFGTVDGTVAVRGIDVPVPIDTSTMADIAQQGGGTSFTAGSAEALGSIYDQIGKDVAWVLKTQEITWIFVGVALLLAIAAAGAALLWTQRIV
jgi:Ca-activated chloride channel homolog